MLDTFKHILQGYNIFREKYARGDASIMESLALHGQRPHIMIIACCDSRVDPALILQCNPGDLFVVRNVANIIPPYEKDQGHHGVSAALEFGISFLNIAHLIILGHSQCGGIEALLKNTSFPRNDFVSDWVSLAKTATATDITNTTNIANIKDTKPTTSDQIMNNYTKSNHLLHAIDEQAKRALTQSHDNSLTFPWIRAKVTEDKLTIHLWFFDIKTGQIFTYCDQDNTYKPLSM